MHSYENNYVQALQLKNVSSTMNMKSLKECYNQEYFSIPMATRDFKTSQNGTNRSNQ